MKIYKVGGAVRDKIMGIESGDVDFVVVGATESLFLDKFPSAKKVGKSFPVFLVNGSEYAFARTEKKTAPGYTGFSVESGPEISLEDDLKRRDLTINAIAEDIDTFDIIDPFGGIEDIKNKRLAHITSSFGEDPLRVYRVARFAAKFPDFTIENKTLALMRGLKDELDTLSPQRVWLETEKALMTGAPWKFFETLSITGTLGVHFTEIDRLTGITPGPEAFHKGEADSFEHTMNVMRLLRIKEPHLFFAALCHDLGKADTPKEILPHHYDHDKRGEMLASALCDRLNAPNSFRKAAMMSAKIHMKAPIIEKLRPSTAIKMLTELRNFPATGINGFYELVFADSRQTLGHLFDFVDKLIPVLDVPLSGRHRNLGKKSGEILLQERVQRYKEIVAGIIKDREKGSEKL